MPGHLRVRSTTATTHIAIQESLNGAAVGWLEEVTDDQYNAWRFARKES